MVYTSLGPSS